MATICTDCRHHKHLIKNPSAPHVWYNHFCGAVEREPAVDPVTGRLGFLGRNDLGTTCVTEDQFHFCRDINRGDCEYFVKIVS